MDVFLSKNYRKQLKERLKSFPNNGYGQSKKLAEYLNVSTAYISQVLAEDRHLSTDQAFLVCEFLDYTKLETSYFMKLIDCERASNHKYKKWLELELEKIRKEASEVSKRIQFDKELSLEDKAIFYSDWYYSAIRMHCSISDKNLEELVEALGISKKLTKDAISFLLSKNLLIKTNEKYRISTSSTHLGSDSPLVKLHHQNWRKKAVERCMEENENKIHYSSPMTLSKKDSEKIKNLLLACIQDIGELVDPSPEEEFMCLNVDWFKV